MKVGLVGTVASSIYGFRSDMIKSLIASGHEVYAFAIDYDESSRLKVLSLGAMPIDYKFSRSGLNPISDFLNTVRLSFEFRRRSLDMVFCYFAKPVIFGTLAATLAGVKLKYGLIEGLGYSFTTKSAGPSLKDSFVKWVQIFLYRLSLPRLNKVIFLNNDDPVDLLGCNNINVRSVEVLGGIGLDLSKYPYSVWEGRNISFLFIGRLLAEKGVHEFIEAAHIVREKHPCAEFVVLGGLDLDNPGALSAEALGRLVKNGLIIYPGHVENVVEWISSTAVFVLPSYREGVPRSTQEAMAVGRPVLTTDVPGCRDTVVNGENGFLVPPRNSAALAEKMIYFIENPQSIKAMGERSFEIAQDKFDSIVVNERLLQMLEL